MVEYVDFEKDRVFHAMSDSIRRDMMRRLAARELSVSQLAKHYPVSLAAVSKHIRVLQEAGLVQKTRSGTTQLCSANLGPLGKVSEVLEELGQFWRGRLDSLQELLEKKEPK